MLHREENKAKSTYTDAVIIEILQRFRGAYDGGINFFKLIKTTNLLDNNNSRTRNKARSYDRIRLFNKIKLVSIYNKKDNKGGIIWVNIMEGIFTLNSLPWKNEMTITTSHCLEGDAYNWFPWWYRKCDQFMID